MFCFSYYCARSFHFKVPPQVAQFITSAQIAQFVIVIYAMLGAQYYMSTGMKVAATPYGLFLGQFTMWAFMVLWLRFYYINYYGKASRYVQRPENGKAVEAKSQ